MREGRTNVGFCRVSVAILCVPLVTMPLPLATNKFCHGALQLEAQRSMMSLTEELVLKRSKASSLEAVRNLNCWGCGLNDVSILARIPNLEVLNIR